MDTSLALRIHGNDSQWSGKNSNQGNGKDRRRQRLEVLFQSIRANDLDSSRLAYASIMNFDPILASSSYLKEIGSALKDGNLYAAQYFIKDIQINFLQFESSTSTLKDTRKVINSSSTLIKDQLTRNKVDISA